MAPAEVESALKILKGFCFTVKLWNQTDYFSTTSSIVSEDSGICNLTSL